MSYFSLFLTSLNKDFTVHCDLPVRSYLVPELLLLLSTLVEDDKTAETRLSAVSTSEVIAVTVGDGQTDRRE